MSLYVVTAPLAKLGLDRVSALEITTVFFDVLISALLAFLAWRFLDDRRAGLLAAAIYAFVRRCCTARSKSLTSLCRS